MTELSTLVESAEHWEGLADEQETRALWNSEHGWGDVSAFHTRARTYRQCALTYRLEIETGKPHCLCNGRAHSLMDCPNTPKAQHARQWSAQVRRLGV